MQIPINRARMLYLNLKASGVLIDSSPQRNRPLQRQLLIGRRGAIVQGLQRIAVWPMQEEKAYIVLLRSQVSMMDRKIYPGLLRRWMVQLSERLLEGPLNRKRFAEIWEHEPSWLARLVCQGGFAARDGSRGAGLVGLGESEKIKGTGFPCR